MSMNVFVFDVRILIILIGLIAATLLVCQSLTLPYKNALRSLSTVDHDILERKGDNVDHKDSSKKLLDSNIGVEIPYNASTFVSTELEMGINEFEK